jgi:hypothetical protein
MGSIGMSDAQSLYQLLPAVHRLRDASQGEPLKALLSVIEQRVMLLEENLAQLYDNQFIETCDEWAVPYIGDLIGWRQLHSVAPKITSPRAEVANTIGYRRRKGTAAMLEQLARDVTGWRARVVEYFQLLSTTQYLNHLRPGNIVTPDLRQWEPLETLGTPFETIPHSLDVRRIARGAGRYNIPNVGIFLWRLNSYRLADAQPRALDARRFFFNPLGNNTPLFTRPEPQPEFGGLAIRMNVPDPIRRRVADAYFQDYYGDGKSLLLKVNGQEVSASDILVGDLADAPGTDWAHQPKDKIIIDPELGRIAFPSNQPPPENVTATFHYGFSSDMGGGEYDRSGSVPADLLENVTWQMGVSAGPALVPGQIVASLAEAVQEWNKQPPGTVGVIAIMDNATYPADISGTGTVIIPAGSRLLIAGATWPLTTDASGQSRRVPGQIDIIGCRPLLRGTIDVQGTAAGPQTPVGQILFNGLAFEAAMTIAGSAPMKVSISHCTLVPGHSLSPDNLPEWPREPSLIVAAPNSQLVMDHSITGGWRTDGTVASDISDSIVDATSPCGVAFSGLDDFGAGGVLRIQNTTVIGKVHTVLMELASNVIFWSRLAVHDAWPAPVWCDRRQSGCVRFSYVPLESKTPRRYQCQPVTGSSSARIAPQFNSVRFGDPAYAQLDAGGGVEIFTGADDGNEMGAFHELREPQRITNLEVRLEEYLRFGLEAGILFEPHLAPSPASFRPYGYLVDLCSEDGGSLPGVGAGQI